MVETHQLSDHFAQANYKLRPKADNMYFRADSNINVWLRKVTQICPQCWKSHHREFKI